MVTGAVDHGEGGGGAVVHAVRHRYQIGFRDQDFFSKGAVASEAHDPLAGLEPLHAFTHSDHFAGHFAAGGKGQLRLDLVFAFNDQGVREVETGGLHFHLHLALAGLGGRDVVDHQLVGGSQFLAQDCAHA